jgi:hypothetical protein
MYKECPISTRLAEYIFFSLPIDRHEYDDYYYYNDGYICGLCGDVVDRFGRKGGVRRHLHQNHPEWMNIHIILGGYSSTMLKKVKESVINLFSSDISLQCRTEEECEEYFCLLCGIPQYKEKRLSHMELNHPEWINAIWCGEKREKYGKKLRTYHLKPWRDPDSLFCSPNLKDIINKEPLNIYENRKTKIQKSKRRSGEIALNNQK